MREACVADLVRKNANPNTTVACASCTEPGGTVNPAARSVATASTAAIKSVQLNLQKIKQIRESTVSQTQ
jgi:hypothetical protein